jgi:hypothetical protein
MLDELYRWGEKLEMAIPAKIAWLSEPPKEIIHSLRSIAVEKLGKREPIGTVQLTVHLTNRKGSL